MLFLTVVFWVLVAFVIVAIIKYLTSKNGNDDMLRDADRKSARKRN